MKMEISSELISYLEDLSYLTLTDGEKHRLAGDLEEILGSIALLGELDTENVPERSHPFDNTNSFREDELKASLDRDLILANAPAADGEMFITPIAVDNPSKASGVLF